LHLAMGASQTSLFVLFKWSSDFEDLFVEFDTKKTWTYPPNTMTILWSFLHFGTLFFLVGFFLCLSGAQRSVVKCSLGWIRGQGEW
jgi:hypothetical protein